MKRVEQFDVRYIIYNRRQWSPSSGWRSYGGASPHTDHLHVEVGPRGTGTPKCAGGSGGCKGHCPKLLEFLRVLSKSTTITPYLKTFPALAHAPAYNLGSLNCRRIGGSSSWSQHAYGTALDIGVKTIVAGDRVRDWLFAEVGASPTPEPAPSAPTPEFRFPDVSKYRPVKDGAALAAATKIFSPRVYGPTDKGALDPQLQHHLKIANDFDLFVWGYWFGQGDRPIGVQVDQFIKAFNPARNWRYIPILDLEPWTGQDMSTDQARSFVADYARKCGFALGLYGMESQSRPGILSRMWRWVARYRADPPGVPVGIKPGHMVAWQFTNGKVPKPTGFPGVAASDPGCDVNYSYIPASSFYLLRRFWPGRFLELGVDPGVDVERLQVKLTEHGVLPGGPTKVTGTQKPYDKATQDAVKRFQEAQNLKADSIVGFETWRKAFAQ